MNEFSKKDYFLYQKILKMTQKDLLHSMKNYLSKYYGKKKVCAKAEFVIAKGNIPIALCAHMDTVFQRPPNEIFYDREQNVIWSPQGAGHDDRAGIFMIMKLIENGYRPHIVLTTDEEIGCVGSEVLVKYKNPFEDNLKYVIQLDRRGADDCVFYWGDNREFVKYVESFGFVENYGSFTDIVTICPAWGVAGTNLSVGYRDEHTMQEVLFVSHWFNTYNKVKNMLSNPPKEAFEYIETPRNRWSLPYSLGPSVTCPKCKNRVTGDDVFPIRRLNGKTENICIDCMLEGVNWCVICNTPFETLDPARSMCYQCETNIGKEENNGEGTDSKNECGEEDSGSLRK